PIWESLTRATLIYVFLLIAIRLTGKRQVGELTPFDIVILLLISEAVSEALNAGKDSLLNAAILVVLLLLLNWGIAFLGTRWKRFDRGLEGRPQLLIRDGRVDYALMRKESISYNELLASLRAEKCLTPHQAEYAVLETSGKISVRKKGE